MSTDRPESSRPELDTTRHRIAQERPNMQSLNIGGSGISKVGGCTFKVGATGDEGFYSNRPRYRVECLTCGELLHENTTAPDIRIHDHAKARAPKDPK